MAKSAAPSVELLAALEKATGVDPNSLRRVVIDIQAGHFPKVYMEQFGDNEGLLSVVEAMTDIQIVQTAELNIEGDDHSE